MATATKIYLRAVRDGDRFKVVDQDGREVAHLQGVSIHAATDDLVRLTIDCLDHDAECQPHTPRR